VLSNNRYSETVYNTAGLDGRTRNERTLTLAECPTLAQVDALNAIDYRELYYYKKYAPPP